MSEASALKRVESKNGHSLAPKQKQTGKRLIGWLVSYALDDKGYAFELRAGRTIVQGGDGNDSCCLNVLDNSVSAPHAALQASPRHNVLIQDIFTEHGTFIRRAGTSEDIAVEGPTSIEHGDWVKFGKNTQFQVCIIDGPSK